MEQNKETAIATLQPQTTTNKLDLFDPTQFATAQRLCKLFATSELVPEIYKASAKNSMEKAVSNCLVAMDMAARIGTSTLTVMQNMDIIYGRPSWRSTFLIGTINTGGKFNRLKFKFEQSGEVEVGGRKIPNIVCRAYTTEIGSDDILEGSPVSVEMAVQQGWYTKSGSKWPSMTEQMLRYRAAAFWCRAYAPEISMGMRTVDEFYDIGEREVQDIPSAELEEIDIDDEE